MSFCDLLINITISSITGVGASFFIWWLTFKTWTPEITFAEAISRLQTTENPSGLKYRFKFENSGRRNIIDIEAIVRLRIKGLRAGFPDNWEVVYLPTSSLDYKKIAIVRPVSGSHVRPVFEIKAYDCAYFEKPIFPQATRDLAIAHQLTVDHILDLGSETNLQVLLLGYDQFSGSRKFFETKEMSQVDIATGGYQLRGLDIAMNTPEEGEDFN